MQSGTATARSHSTSRRGCSGAQSRSAGVAEPSAGVGMSSPAGATTAP
ncbi:hypothetical protein ACFPM0_12435 [Pseudonocardia sulfidoxydans]